jgi:hypothetical protein
MAFHKLKTYKSLKASPLLGADDNLNTFSNYTNQEERDQSYGFNVALSESLLVLVNNYVKATRFVFWLRENVKTRMGKAR